MEKANVSAGRIRKRILFVHQNLVVGGAEELRLTILKHIDRNKFDITLCSIENGGLIAEEIKKLGFEIVSLNHKCSLWDLRIAWDIYRLIQKRHFDIIQTSLFYANMHGRIAAFMAGVPVIISEEHNIYAWKEKYPVFILIDRLLSKITHKIITCSDSVKIFTSRQEGIPLAKFLTIHNCVDIHKFSLARTKEDLRADYDFGPLEKIIIIVGTLCEQKGHKYLLEAFRKIKNEVSDARLLIVGSGPLEEELQKQSRLLHIEGEVKFMRTRRDVPQLLKISDVLVLSSLWEGFGIVLLEAMASGLAVVASNIDGVPEVVLDGETGILVPPKDIYTLSKVITDLLLNVTQREVLATAGRKRVLENFTPESYLNKLNSLYHKFS